jgi:hypothetical protein
LELKGEFYWEFKGEGELFVFYCICCMNGSYNLSHVRVRTAWITDGAKLDANWILLLCESGWNDGAGIWSYEEVQDNNNIYYY